MGDCGRSHLCGYCLGNHSLNRCPLTTAAPPQAPPQGKDGGKGYTHGGWYGKGKGGAKGQALVSLDASPRVVGMLYRGRPHGPTSLTVRRSVQDALSERRLQNVSVPLALNLRWGRWSHSVGLVNNTELNGELAEIVTPADDVGRCTVRLTRHSRHVRVPFCRLVGLHLKRARR